MNSNNHNVLRVRRTKAQAKKSYDRISHFYDFFAGGFESKYRNLALQQLNIETGEIVLEIGFGTGHCLMEIAKSVGKEGKVYGVDISSGMLEVTKKRLEKAGLSDRVELFRGDARKMPYADNRFDSVFMSFTLELFDTPEIQNILKEIRRILKPNGKLGVASMSKEGDKSLIMRLYEWAHKKISNFVDCRPIYVEESLKEAGFTIAQRKKMRSMGLTIEIVLGINADI